MPGFWSAKGLVATVADHAAVLLRIRATHSIESSTVEREVEPDGAEVTREVSGRETAAVHSGDGGDDAVRGRHGKPLARRGAHEFAIGEGSFLSVSPNILSAKRRGQAAQSLIA